MRLWSLHPRYLDAKGLVALWREGLLAARVLEGATRGYRHHPQLQRFRGQADPVRAIHAYLSPVLEEARRRGYRFDAEKLSRTACNVAMPVTSGQLAYEAEHLRGKLARRDLARLEALPEHPEPHPCFRIVPGPIEVWERP
ncbi:MAG TPA: pyrimidine dimer DNA glycosylase/endonuclease V [bacterium]|nr:pyrimidine dimer DNA glycosylase/endonuclease V [bacterium]